MSASSSGTWSKRLSLTPACLTFRLAPQTSSRASAGASRSSPVCASQSLQASRASFALAWSRFTRERSQKPRKTSRWWSPRRNCRRPSHQTRLASSLTCSKRPGRGRGIVVRPRQNSEKPCARTSAGATQLFTLPAVPGRIILRVFRGEVLCMPSGLRKKTKTTSSNCPLRRAAELSTSSATQGRSTDRLRESAAVATHQKI